MRGDRFEVANNALVAPGERYTRVQVDRLTITGAAAFKLYAVMRLYTDSKGQLHASRERLAQHVERSTRTVRRLLNQLRPLGYSVASRVFVYAEKTVRSTRKELSSLSRKRSRQSAHTHSEQRAADDPAAFERKRDLAKRRFADWLR